jgi:hypothetical protein
MASVQVRFSPGWLSEEGFSVNCYSMKIRNQKQKCVMFGNVFKNVFYMHFVTKVIDQSF